jgi:gag-polypeptide of LTR copia-type
MNDIMKIDLVQLAADGTNWVTYHDRLKITLQMCRWQDHLTSSSVTKAYINCSDINNIKPDMRWEDNDEAVKHLMMNSVPDDIFNRIKGGTNTKTWWDSLKAICEGRLRSLLIDLGWKLQNMCCKEDDDVCAHFAKLANIRKQLTAMGETVGDQQYTNILLASLPSCYEMHVCAITMNADETSKDLDSSQIVKHISDNYDKCMISKHNGKKADDQAFIASTQYKKDKCDLECFNCKKKGHIKANCWAKGGGKEGQCPVRKKHNNKDKSTSSAAAATDDISNEDIKSWAAMVVEEDPQESDKESWTFAEEDYSSDEDLYEALSEDSQDQVASTSGDTEAELYDSGASRHITPFQHHFLTYHAITPRPITAANK